MNNDREIFKTALMTMEDGIHQSTTYQYQSWGKVLKTKTGVMSHVCNTFLEKSLQKWFRINIQLLLKICCNKLLLLIHPITLLTMILFEILFMPLITRLIYQVQIRYHMKWII